MAWLRRLICLLQGHNLIDVELPKGPFMADVPDLRQRLRGFRR